MIVDLSRNDLGRVARWGSVEPGAIRAEPHPGLWHLVTDVRARVREGTTDADLVRAAFPPGSVTGAPKIQALKVIADLEGSQREAYTGAIGFASPHAGLQLNVAIRTLELAGGRAWLGCGGGIVADSDPQAELREALGKVAPIAARARRPRARARRRQPRRRRRRAGRGGPTPRAGCWRRSPSATAGPSTPSATWRGWPPPPARSTASTRSVELPAEAPDGRLRVLLAPDGDGRGRGPRGARRGDRGRARAALAGRRPGPAQVARPPAGPRVAGRRPRRRRARGGVGERLDRGRRRRPADPAGRRAHPARDHARAAAGGARTCTPARPR